MEKFIIVKFRFEGVHNWPGCHIEEVDFLKSPHRHMFHVEAMKQVSHDNREIEIIRFKREMTSWIEQNYKGNFESMSCEHIATVLLKMFDLDSCTVLEDGENGAMVKK